MGGGHSHHHHHHHDDDHHYYRPSPQMYPMNQPYPINGVVSTTHHPPPQYQNSPPSYANAPQDEPTDADVANEHADRNPMFVSAEDQDQNDRLIQGEGKVPEGYLLKFTAAGQPYLAARDMEGGEDEEAMSEHLVTKTPLNAPLEEIEKRYGLGTAFVFHFKKFIMVCNLVLIICGLAGYIPAILDRDTSISWGTSILFISALAPDTYWMWFSTASVMVALSLLIVPIFLFWAARIEKRELPKHDNPYYWAGVDIITENLKYSHRSRLFRRFTSYFFTLFLCAILCGATYGLEQLNVRMYNADSRTRNSVWNPYNFAITGFISIANFGWHVICDKLTSFERHRTWGRYRQSQTVKLFGFRILNVSAMYLSLKWAYAADQNCVLEAIGSKFLALMLSDLFVTFNLNFQLEIFI
eukprot:TRINITY_DN3893_c0_g1_i1.p1 TRINITY_DN3893_c0_g1~~TRINITY_DN3893_c0_g1_i1.p1  ORF type:complete len:412 (-),score=103.44 TRINITY_DN3893_c0_g1_i1:439-1674(-)